MRCCYSFIAGDIVLRIHQAKLISIGGKWRGALMIDAYFCIMLLNWCYFGEITLVLNK